MRIKTLSFHFLVVSLVLFSPTLHAQDKQNVDSIRRVSARKAWEERNKNEDAVMLLQHRTVTNRFRIYSSFLSSYNPYYASAFQSQSFMFYNTDKGFVERVFQRIKILTQRGADEYSKIYIPKSTNGKIISIRARTIKPDSTIIPVNKEDIKEIQNVTNGGFGWHQGHYRFSIPGVEVGDEIEVEYTMTRSDDMTLSGDYFFSTHLPVAESVLDLWFSGSLTVNIKNYNGLQNPEQSTDGRYYRFRYTRYSLGALRDVDHAILYNEMPYCRYQILSVHSPFDTGPRGTKIGDDNWTDFSKGLLMSMPNEKLKGAKSQYLTEFVGKHFAIGKESPYAGLRNMIRLIFDSITIEQSYQKPEYTSGYYLYNKKIPVSAIARLYTDLFDCFGIDYFYCLGAIKTRGKIDTNMISGGDFSTLFFAYNDENDSLRYLFADNSIYKINPEEIHPQYLGANFLLISRKTPGKHAFMKLPDYPHSINYKKRINQINADLERNLLSYYCCTERAGTFSYLDQIWSNQVLKDSLSSGWKNYFMNEMKNFVLDTSYNTASDSEFPFKSRFIYKGRQQDKIVKVGDSLYAIDLTEWLDHSVLPAYSDDRFVDYYPDFRFSEQFVYQYSFKQPVEVENPASLSGGINNNFGNYQFSVTQVSDTVIIVKSAYRILKSRLPSYEYSQLRQLYDQWALFKNTSFLVRIKPNATPN